MSDWIRARHDFKCRICGKPDWCTYAPKFSGWCCMRTVSQRPLKNGGYWHSDSADIQYKHVPKPAPEIPQIDAERVMGECYDATRPEWITKLAELLGVHRWSLIDIGAAWAPRKVLKQYMDWRGKGAWAFPMRNGSGHPVGVRLRTNEGQKISIRGSREGVFVPNTGYSKIAYIVEGPTDLSALLSLGAWGFGRPSCRGCISHMQVTINRLRISRVIIIGDNDLAKWENEKSPGIDGAKNLAAELHVPVASLLLPTKDTRQFVKDGGNLKVLEAMANHVHWRYPK